MIWAGVLYLNPIAVTILGSKPIRKQRPSNTINLFYRFSVYKQYSYTLFSPSTLCKRGFWA